MGWHHSGAKVFLVCACKYFEVLNTQRFGRLHLDHSGITLFDHFRVFFKNFTTSSVHFTGDCFKFTSNMCGVNIQNWGVTSVDFTWVVHDNSLSFKTNGAFWCVVFGVTATVSSFDVFDRQVFNIETSVVTWNGFWELFVMHFYGFDFSGVTSWGKSDNHTWFDFSGFDSADWDGSDTTNFVDILKRKSKGFAVGSFWDVNAVDSVE